MEKDWKIYSKLIPDLRERYLKEKNIEIKQILEADDKSETDRFWDAEAKIEKERKILVDCLDDHSRSNMLMHMILMYKYGMLREADLSEFSAELRDRIKTI